MNAANDELRRSIADCAGLTTVQISEKLLANHEQDDVTRELMLMCQERSDTAIFRTMPLTIRQTMYGDDDISDWILRYQEDGSTSIEEAEEEVEVDAHVRWERWEDCVRLVNNNVQAMSLFYAFRTIALGEGDFRSNGRWWFMGIDFANLGQQRPGHYIGYLRGHVWGTDEELDAYVEEVGLDTLLEARARVLGYTMCDLGASELLAGSWLRWEIEGHDNMAQVDFDDKGGFAFGMLNHAEAASIDPDGGVTTLFVDRKPFLYTAGGREELTGQLVSGTAKLVGNDERKAAFSAATRKMYSPGAMSGS